MTNQRDGAVHLDVDREGHIARLTIDRPDRKNAYDPPMREQMRRHLHEVADDDDVKVLVLRGAEGVFSTGADMANAYAWYEKADGPRRRPSQRRRLAVDRNAFGFYHDLMHYPKVTVAQVERYALGGGFEMALSADYIIAEEHSSFGFPEIMFGLFPCTGAMGLLARRVGAIRAERMMTENKIYTAQQLLDMGVIDEVCPTGAGERTTEAYIARHTARQKAFLKVQQSRIRMSPFDYVEAEQIVHDWVELAMGLTAEELRTLDMLILMQEGGRKPKTADRKAA